MSLTIALKILVRYAILVGYLVGIVILMRHFPQEQTVFAVVGCSCFYVLYLLPIVLFSTDIEVTPEGLIMRRLRTILVPFSQVHLCIGVFLIPFQIVVVLAKSNGKSIIALTFDSPPRVRRSIFQRGALAAAINERVAAARG